MNSISLLRSKVTTKIWLPLLILIIHQVAPTTIKKIYSNVNLQEYNNHMHTSYNLNTRSQSILHGKVLWEGTQHFYKISTASAMSTLFTYKHTIDFQQHKHEKYFSFILVQLFIFFGSKLFEKEFFSSFFSRRLI